MKIRAFGGLFDIVISGRETWAAASIIVQAMLGQINRAFRTLAFLSKHIKHEV
jgi:hypothetical protein